MKRSLLLPLAGLSLFVAGSLAAQTCPTPSASMFPGKPAAFTHTVIVTTGNWHDTSTWDTGTVPGDNAIVCIPAGRSVTYRTLETNPDKIVRYIQANGEFRIGRQESYRLYVDTIYVDTGGSFGIGGPGFPVDPEQKVEVVFKSWDGGLPDIAWDPERKSFGLIAMGPVKVYGAGKTHMVPMTHDALKTETTLTLDSAPANWLANDQVVITGSYFRQVATDTSSQDEVRTLQSAVSGTGVTLTSGLTYDHIRPASNLRLHVANLTRNVIFRSELPSSIQEGVEPETLRGHIMLMDGDVEFQNVAFVDLGRTNKGKPLDDFAVTLYPPAPATPTDYSIEPRKAALVGNRRGRYALHFHLNGTLPGQTAPSQVSGCVVNGTLGWGFVSHGSHVDFSSNVAYNFVGAGFVTEFGNELGTFSNNIAIRGLGDGIYDPVRMVFANEERPQPLADFAFRGDGFWFQGPAVRAIDNVAAGCDGAGMIWHATGSPDVNDRYTLPSGRVHNRYSYFPRSALSTVYSGFTGLSPRHWSHSVTDEKLVIADLPILENDGFEGYGDYVGFRLRFNNHDSTAWYGEVPFNYTADIVNPSADGRVGQTVENLKLWNNQHAFSLRYVAKTEWDNVAATSRLDYNFLQPVGVTGDYRYGGELFFSIEDIVFDNLLIDGYETAGVIERSGGNGRSDVTFTTAPDYRNYLTFDTLLNVACNTPVLVSLTTIDPATRRVTLQTDSTHLRYLARYRVVGDQQWKLATSTTNQVDLTGLATGKNYEYQVGAGCKNGSGVETAPSAFFGALTFSN